MDKKREITKQRYERAKRIVSEYEAQTTTCEIRQENDRIVLDFYSDCGKFGTNEMLDGYKLTPNRLLQILQDRDDYSEDEL